MLHVLSMNLQILKIRNFWPGPKMIMAWWAITGLMFSLAATLSLFHLRRVLSKKRHGCCCCCCSWGDGRRVHLRIVSETVFDCLKAAAEGVRLLANTSWQPSGASDWAIRGIWKFSSFTPENAPSLIAVERPLSTRTRVTSALQFAHSPKGVGARARRRTREEDLRGLLGEGRAAWEKSTDPMQLKLSISSVNRNGKKLRSVKITIYSFANNKYVIIISTKLPQGDFIW